MIVALIYEKVEAQIIINCSGPILYTGIVVVGGAYTLQIFR